MIKVILLGFIQAITEFLPVSSSGHLRISEYFLDFYMENVISFEIALHFGTFLATCLIFRKDIFNAIKGFFIGLKDIKNSSRNNEDFRVAIMVIVASIPVAIVGLLFEKYLSHLELHRIGLNLVITGSILLLTKKYDRTDIEKKDALSTTYFNALLIGIAQSIAVLPGISRSGMTISIALFLGINREFSGKFSFLISLPAIFGALILSIDNIMAESFNLTYALIGFTTAFVFGIFALKFLLSFLKSGKLFHFGFYCIIVGTAVFLYFTTISI